MRRFPRSQKRVPGGVVGPCVACEHVRTLRHGHVVSEWVHTWVKNEGGGRIHGRYPSLGIPEWTMQDGIKHYLLCDECEELMSVAERYMRALMVGTVEERRSIGVLEIANVFGGVRVDLVQRFLLGTALRGHFATGGEFHAFRLPNAALPAVRRAVLQGPASDAEFVIFAVRLVCGYPGADVKAAVSASFRQVAGYAPAFRLIGGGWDWIAFFCGDDPRGAKEFFDIRLRGNGVLPIVVQEFTDNPTIRDLLKLPDTFPQAKDSHG